MPTHTHTLIYSSYIQLSSSLLLGASTSFWELRLQLPTNLEQQHTTFFFSVVLKLFAALQITISHFCFLITCHKTITGSSSSYFILSCGRQWNSKFSTKLYSKCKYIITQQYIYSTSHGFRLHTCPNMLYLWAKLWTHITLKFAVLHLIWKWKF